MKIALVASSDLPIVEAISNEITGLISALKEQDGTLLLRESFEGAPASPVELGASLMAAIEGVYTVFYRPTPGGRAEVFQRDYRLVEAADQVIAIFSHGRALEGGTGHVVHAAMQKGTPVIAYEVGAGGTSVHILMESDGDA